MRTIIFNLWILNILLFRFVNSVLKWNDRKEKLFLSASHDIMLILAGFTKMLLT